MLEDGKSPASSDTYPGDGAEHPICGPVCQNQAENGIPSMEGGSWAPLFHPNQGDTVLLCNVGEAWGSPVLCSSEDAPSFGLRGFLIVISCSWGFWCMLRAPGVDTTPKLSKHEMLQGHVSKLGGILCVPALCSAPCATVFMQEHASTLHNTLHTRGHSVCGFAQSPDLTVLLFPLCVSQCISSYFCRKHCGCKRRVLGRE